jgi:hypothetical protein
MVTVIVCRYRGGGVSGGNFSVMVVLVVAV